MRKVTRQLEHLHRLVPSALAYAILILVTVLAVVPIAWGFVTSLKPESQVLTTPPQWIPKDITLHNYVVVLFQSDMPRYLLNSLAVSLVSVVITVAVAAHAAYAAARFRFRGRTSLMFLVLMTSMIPGIAVLIPLYLLAVQVGIYDTYQVLILIYAAWQVPTLVWLLKGYFESIPKEIEDAALIDGCSSYRVFLQVMLPLARPGLAASALIAFVYVWNDFLIATSMVTNSDLRMISVGLYSYITQYGIVWGQLMAAVMLAVVPMLIVFAAAQRQFVAGLTEGATKGG
jgi:multiple sugar transport system permease protein